MSLPKLLLHEHSCMYANRGDVATYHIVSISLCLRSVPSVRVPASAASTSISYCLDQSVLEERPGCACSC